MNLKDAFRYQNFLEKTLSTATRAIWGQTNALRTTKIHKKSVVNPEAENITEVINDEKSYDNDKVVKLLVELVKERQAVSEAIGKAKASADFDIDAAIATNKFRQEVASSIKSMLVHRPSKTTERGTDYKFNVEGNQTPYYYEIEVSKAEAFDRVVSKATMSELIKEADEVSTQIDAAFVNIVLDFKPLFDVNDSFDDIVDCIA